MTSDHRPGPATDPGPDVGPAGATRADVEAELAAYYQEESGLRHGRPVEGRRADARDRALAGVLAPLRGRLLLDLGSGPGRDTAALREAGHEVVAVDLAPANARAAGAPALVASAVELPLADGSVAGVWSMSALMHVPTVAIGAALRELARVVAPGGPLVLGTWGGPDREERLLNPELGLPRLFSRRSDPVWRRLLEREVGRVERFESWTDVGADDWRYQFVEVRTGAGGRAGS